jgi:hypothetical protein
MRNWGRWGNDDRRGALNLITREAGRGCRARPQWQGVPLGRNIQADGVPMVKDSARGFWMHLTVYDGDEAPASPPEATTISPPKTSWLSATTEQQPTPAALATGWQHGKLYNDST